MMAAPSLPRRQRGAALIIALVIVAIATIVMTQLVWKTHLDQRRVENQLYSAQAITYAIGAEDWAREILMRDDSTVDHLGEDWAAQDARFPIEGGTLIGTITDLQGRFNLNNLYDESQQGTEDEVRQEMVEAFSSLLATQGAGPEIAMAVLDWQDADIDPAGMGGAEDSSYSRQVPPYLTPNAPLFSPTELRAVAGVEPDIYLAIRDFVTALPADGTPVNINTAPSAVIQAMANEMDDASVQAILEYREQGGISDLNELDNLLGPGPGGQPFPNDRFSVKSNWFLLTVRAQIGSTAITMYSLLHRDDGGMVTPVARTLGTW